VCVVSNNQDIRLNSVLEKIIVDIVKGDESDFLALVRQSPVTALQDRSNKELGFRERYEALISRQPL